MPEDIRFSPQTLNAVRALDRNGDGVSYAELKSLDTDASGAVSEPEALAAGMEIQDISRINQTLQQAAGRSPGEIAFVETVPARGGALAIQNRMAHDSTLGFRSLIKEVFAKYPSKSDLAEKTAVLARATGIPAERLTPVIQRMVDHQLIQNDPFSFAAAELFLKRYGLEKGVPLIDRVCAFGERKGTGLSAQQQTEVVQDLFQDLAVPNAINQESRGTCASCAIQTLLAIVAPEKYIQMVTSLAQGKSCQLSDGNQLKPDDSWKKPAQIQDGRRMSEKLMQNAITNLALGGSGYDSSLDTGSSQPAPSIGQQQSALEKILGADKHYDDDFWQSKSAQMGYVEDEIARGRPAIVNFWGHAFLVVGIDRTGPEANVVFDTYGNQFQMPQSQFEKYIMSSVTIDDTGSDDQRVPAGRRVVVDADLTRFAKP
ncbi:MAG: hypothetical protein ACAI44_22375 [Candidatus Sericytochromatia bacterium]